MHVYCKIIFYDHDDARTVLRLYKLQSEMRLHDIDVALTQQTETTMIELQYVL